MTNNFRKIFGVTVAMALIATTLVAQTAPAQDPLVQVLVQKGVLTSRDAGTITGNAQEQRDRLAQLLREKGILSASDVNSVRGSLPAGTLMPVTYATQAKAAAPGEAKAAAPTVIPAVAPIRVLQLEPAKVGGLVPDVKLGSGARLKFYGYLKLDSAYDTSDPSGTDGGPLKAGFGAASGNALGTALNGSPDYHLHPRASRLGMNFEWPDISPKVAVTGKFEADFVGAYPNSGSTIRNFQPRIRLAYGRVDYKATDKTSVYVLGGQDFTLFGSSTLPNILEINNFWEGFGSMYQRAPQLRTGLTHRFGGITVGGDFAITQSGWGFNPDTAITCTTAAGPPLTTTCTNGAANLGTLLSTGEVGSGFSQRPDIMGRLVFQWQLDHAKGVAPAQIIFSGDQGRYVAHAVPSLIPATAIGSDAEVTRKGYTVEAQLPTRWVTLVAKYFRGSGINFFAGSGAGSTFYTDTLATTTAGSAKAVTDLSSNRVTYITTATGFVPAPLQPVRSQGGIVQIGFPLSRIFNADPAGRNAGWQLLAGVGLVSPFAHDMIKASTTTPIKNQYVANGTLLYKLNQFVTFGLEESYFAGNVLTNINNYGTAGAGPLTSGCAAGTTCSHIFPDVNIVTNNTFTFPGTSTTAANVLGVGTGSIVRGIPAKNWHDFRSQFSTIFTF